MKTGHPFRLLTAISLTVLLSYQTTGCTSTRTTSTTTVKTQETSEAPSPQPPTKVVTEKSETVTDKGSATPWCGGLLSCTVEGVGWVLALPFRLVGGVIDVLF
jgi:hypothetical protein